MSTVAFDTLAYANRLKEAGVPPEQAEAHVAAQADFLTQHILSEVATKDDIRALKDDLRTLKSEMDARFSEVDLRFEQVDTRFAELETRLTLRIGGMVAALGLFMGILEFFQ